MVNPYTSEVNQEVKDNLSELTRERRKAAAHCLNLECQNEQLKILIERLHGIADQRADLITKTTNPGARTNHPYLGNSSILEELKRAKENSKSIETIISEVKDRILKLDKLLSS
ncbi:MAG: hypothetical protein ACD_20C00104G0019 [uncultured bacterium]|nr:MAG: hypothetical protein ACD_20C00104G0019 [uncultured bacterium]HBH17715.1 hypothetical protein [Cyanobacteria bacterium UBA9579]